MVDGSVGSQAAHQGPPSPVCTLCGIGLQGFPGCPSQEAAPEEVALRDSDGVLGGPSDSHLNMSLSGQEPSQVSCGFTAGMAHQVLLGGQVGCWVGMATQGG